MATFVSDCPRCSAKRSTHDCYASVWVGMKHGWQNYNEVFAVCRSCNKPSILLLSQESSHHDLDRVFKERNKLVSVDDSIDELCNFERVVSRLDFEVDYPPEFVPPEIEAVFLEGSKCLAVQCWNASAAMYRLTLDLATKGLLPEENGPNAKVQRSLGLRLNWLFENGHLPSDLKNLAVCIQQDGNDGAHDGALGQEDAEDIRDFSYELLRRLYTDPKRIENAELRRAERREKKT